MNYIVLPKAEWDRLQKQAGHTEISQEVKYREETDKRIQALNETSQKWISTWPDSVQAVTDKVEKRKEKRRENNLKMKKDLRYLQELAKSERINAIQKAKQRIFETSGYGKGLLSALTASKTLEEREAQIKLQKEIKKEQQLEKELGPKGMSLDFGRDYDAEEAVRKNNIREVKQINRETERMTKEKLAEDKQKEQILEIEDARRTERLLEFEAHAMDLCKSTAVQMAKDFEDDQKKFRETRAIREKLDEDIAKVWSDYHDRVWCKERQVKDRLNKSSYKPYLKVNYEVTQKLQEEANKRFQDFIDKGVERMENELSKKEQEDTEAKLRKKESRIEQVEFNKKMADEKEEMLKGTKVCERQSLFTKSCGKQKHKKETCPDEEEGVYHPPPFRPYHRSNDLEQSLRKREKEPSPFNATEGAHAYFAKEADQILAQCKYKRFARKAVDEYRYLNGLDSTTLPVPNY